MSGIFLAFLRSLASLTRPRVWSMILLPAAFSLLVWLGLAIWGQERLFDGLMQCPPMPQLLAWDVAWLARSLAFLGSWMLIFALAFFSAALLAANLLMPILLRRVAERDYADLALMGNDSFSAGVVNSLVASLVFVLAWLVSIPFWLVPGMAILLPLLLMAWFNRRTFAYDALSLHATEGEWRRIRTDCRRGLFLIGLIMAILVYVPFLGLLAPALTALVFIHYCLEALRRMRGDAVVTGEARAVIEGEFSEVDP